MERKMQLLTQQMLSVLKSGRLGSSAGSMKPSWIMCGGLVVAPLPPVGMLLTDAGYCQHEVVHPH